MVLTMATTMVETTMETTMSSFPIDPVRAAVSQLASAMSAMSSTQLAPAQRSPDALPLPTQLPPTSSTEHALDVLPHVPRMTMSMLPTLSPPAPRPPSSDSAPLRMTMSRPVPRVRTTIGRQR